VKVTPRHAYVGTEERRRHRGEEEAQPQPIRYLGARRGLVVSTTLRPPYRPPGKSLNAFYEGWNFNSGNYLFTTDTK